MLELGGVECGGGGLIFLGGVGAPSRNYESVSCGLQKESFDIVAIICILLESQRDIDIINRDIWVGRSGNMK